MKHKKIKNFLCPRKAKLFSGSKKAMAIGQVFIFIVAAITFALIMIFGYKAISDFMQKGEQVEFFDFKANLEKAVKEIYTEYGSVRIQEFRLPARYDQICFVDLDFPYPGDQACTFNFAACDAWKTASQEDGWSQAPQNVFLDPLPPEGSPSIKVYRLNLADQTGFLCLNINKGRFKLKLEGKGDKTELSEAPRT